MKCLVKNNYFIVKFFKNSAAIILCALLFGMQVTAFELDTTVDDEIRKNYNPNKIEQDLLPPLPQNLKETQNVEQKTPSKSISTNTTTQQKIIQQQSTPKIQQTTKKIEQPNIVQHEIKKATDNQIKTATLKKGTKFYVKLMTNVSDRSPHGAGFTLKNLRPVTTTYFTIPTGALFKGKIEDSHAPQMFGNGGLIVMNVDRVIVNGQTYYLQGKITKTNSKKIFFNNIKGKRTYLKNMGSSTKIGRTFYNRMWETTCSWAGDSTTLILSPFSFLAGVMVLGANVIVSPAVASFKKGGNIYVNAGSILEIKLLEDSIIYQ